MELRFPQFFVKRMQSLRKPTTFPTAKVARYWPVACFYFLLAFSFVSFLIFILPVYSLQFTWTSTLAHYFALTSLATLGAFLVFSCLWSYLMVSRTSPGLPMALQSIREQEQFSSQSLANANEEKHESIIDILADAELADSVKVDMPILVKQNGKERYCRKCNIVKPDRTHHCRKCNRCVLKMDHHCPWVNNCIGYFNYKYYILFIYFATLYTLFILATCLPVAIQLGLKNELTTLAFPISIALSVLSFAASGNLLLLTAFHTMLVFKNKTTIEVLEKKVYKTKYPDAPVTKNPFNLGMKSNFIEIMGPEPWQWFLPVNEYLGNGETFPLNPACKTSEETLSNAPALDPALDIV